VQAFDHRRRRPQQADHNKRRRLQVEQIAACQGKALMVTSQMAIQIQKSRRPMRPLIENNHCCRVMFFPYHHRLRSLPWRRDFLTSAALPDLIVSRQKRERRA
jgi:hypothetical protein